MHRLSVVTHVPVVELSFRDIKIYLRLILLLKYNTTFHHFIVSANINTKRHTHSVKNRGKKKKAIGSTALPLTDLTYISTFLLCVVWSFLANHTSLRAWVGCVQPISLSYTHSITSSLTAHGSSSTRRGSRVRCASPRWFNAGGRYVLELFRYLQHNEAFTNHSLYLKVKDEDCMNLLMCLVHCCSLSVACN